MREFASTRDTFQLFTDCSKIYAVVAVIDEDNDLPELTESSVKRAVLSRLRAARVYDPVMGDTDGLLHLKVTVTIVRNAYDVRTALWRLVNLDLSSEARGIARVGAAATWETATTGTSGYDAGYVRDVVAGHLDQFIDEYLRVNEDSCPR